MADAEVRRSGSLPAGACVNRRAAINANSIVVILMADGSDGQPYTQDPNAGQDSSFFTLKTNTSLPVNGTCRVSAGCHSERAAGELIQTMFVVDELICFTASINRRVNATPWSVTQSTLSISETRVSNLSR